MRANDPNKAPVIKLVETLIRGAERFVTNLEVFRNA